jgi:hypothetical protein
MRLLDPPMTQSNRFPGLHKGQARQYNHTGEQPEMAFKSINHSMYKLWGAIDSAGPVSAPPQSHNNSGSVKSSLTPLLYFWTKKVFLY